LKETPVATYVMRPHADEDKSVLYGTFGFIVVAVVVIVIGHVFGWI